jgi:hypothetical protein
MQVNSIGHNLNIKNNKHNNQSATSAPYQGGNSVAFTGAYKVPNAIVKLMDFIAAGGFAASFCIQDGIGFIAPRVGKGLLRGGKIKRDEDGNKILDKNGEPKRELNWAYARKEGLREIITGPSTFVIPYFLLKGINKKFGRMNSVRLDYIDGFKNTFADFVKDNMGAIKSGNADRKSFYTEIFKDVIDKSVNTNLPKNDQMSAKEIAKKASDFAEKQIKTEEICRKFAGFSKRKQRANELAKLGSSLEDDFMSLIKNKVGGTANDMAAAFSASNGKDLKHGSIGELTTALGNYFDDAVKTVHKALKENKNASIEDIMKQFTKHKMGTRILTNLGLFLTVAAFYTQIPKLYNMGTHGKNPALAYEEDEQPALQNNKTNSVADNDKPKAEKSKNVSFGGKMGIIEKAGDWVFNGKKLKSISDIFELNGPIIQGNAMAVLLYGACIPPRLINAQDKYDYGEIMLRDMTAFTALLFGAKALARLFSDGFTKLTGLALNKKDMEGRSVIQKVWDYLNPSDARHSILSSKQLEYKYTNLQNYRNGVDGFVEFIEKSGGNIKKALANDDAIKSVVEDILKDFNGKSYADATKEEIKQALHLAKETKSKHLDKFYELFKKSNKLMNRAKTCNSFFGALSTLVLVPGLIIGLTDLCKYMTDKRKAKEKLLASQQKPSMDFQAAFIPSNKPTMAGFLNNK